MWQVFYNLRIHIPIDGIVKFHMVIFSVFVNLLWWRLGLIILSHFHFHWGQWPSNVGWWRFLMCNVRYVFWGRWWYPVIIKNVSKIIIWARIIDYIYGVIICIPGCSMAMCLDFWLPWLLLWYWHLHIWTHQMSPEHCLVVHTFQILLSPYGMFIVQKNFYWGLNFFRSKSNHPCFIGDMLLNNVDIYTKSIDCCSNTEINNIIIILFLSDIL